MPEHLISDRPRFGRDTLLWRDSDQVWRETRPHLSHFAATRPQHGPIHTVRCVFPVRHRTLRQRLAEAWFVFWRG